MKYLWYKTCFIYQKSTGGSPCYECIGTEIISRHGWVLYGRDSAWSLIIYYFSDFYNCLTRLTQESIQPLLKQKMSPDENKFEILS